MITLSDRQSTFLIQLSTLGSSNDGDAVVVPVITNWMRDMLLPSVLAYPSYAHAAHEFPIISISLCDDSICSSSSAYRRRPTASHASLHCLASLHIAMKTIIGEHLLHQYGRRYNLCKVASASQGRHDGHEGLLSELLMGL